VLAARADALLRVRCTFQPSQRALRIHLRRRVSAAVPTQLPVQRALPRKIGLNWFIPLFAKSSVGSSTGTTGLLATMSCSRPACVYKVH